MSAGHHAPSSDAPRRETIMDTRAGAAGGSARRAPIACANDTVCDAKFTMDNPTRFGRAARARELLPATRGAASPHNLHLSARLV